MPVNGRVPPWAEDPVLVGSVELELPLAGVEGAVDGEELLELDDEPLEPEDELEDDEGVELACVVLFRGSTYWLSPAEVLVPDASTAAAPVREPATSPIRHAKIRMTRRTLCTLTSRAADRSGDRPYRCGWRMCPARTVASLAEKIPPPATGISE
jgi:hypothetical protein